MNNENRKKEWAVLISEKITEGETIVVELLRPCGMHGGSYLEKEVKSIEVLAVKEIAPNMVLAETEETDYYVYQYNLYAKKLSHMDGSNGWTIEEKPKIGEKCLFTRRVEKNGYREGSFTTPNPIFEIQVIHSSIAIAWCKDEMGEDIGYVIRTESFPDAPKGNYYWIWELEAQKAGKKSSGCIIVDLDGKRNTSFITFVPKKATAIGDWTVFEAEDGNFYICQVPMEIGWEE